MYYIILGKDYPDSLDKRLSARPAHLSRLHALQEQGRLLIAGPMPAIDTSDPGTAGFTGSVIIAEFADLAEASAWADQDPYVAAGVYVSVDVQPFKKVLPA